jgi:pilus assembly protein Flp/PilA
VSDFLTELFVRMQNLSLPERNEDGAVATEYAILIVGIALVIIIGVKAFGTALGGWFQNLAGQLPLS